MERLDLMFVKRINKPGNKTLGNDGSEEFHLLLNLLYKSMKFYVGTRSITICLKVKVLMLRE